MKNPWNCFHLFTQDHFTILEWCVRNRLISGSRPCSKEYKDGNDTSVRCGGTMNMCKRFGKSCGASLRCNLNHSHEVSILSHSFFENSKLLYRTYFVFVKYYLEKSTLKQCACFVRNELRQHCSGLGFYDNGVF